MRKVEIKSKKLIFDDFFKVQEAILRYQRFDGQMTGNVRRLNFERGDSVAAIILNRDNQSILLVNQFKYPTYEKGPGWIYETVAGVCEKNKSPEDAMRREMLEEVGYKVSNLSLISTFYLSPGGTSERIILYYAEVGNADRVSKGGGVASEDEDIEVVELSLPEAWKALALGEIIDAKTIIALMWLRNKLEAEH